MNYLYNFGICYKVLVMKITHSFTIYVSQRTKELEKIQSMGVQIEINQFHLKYFLIFTQKLTKVREIF